MRVLIGHVNVDAGLVWLGDPCYVLGDEASSRVRNWSDLCEKLHGPGKTSSAPLGDGVGIAVSSGYGDGRYPVYADLDESGTVRSVTVQFLGGEE